jgi:hypothetical protein
MAGPKYPYKYQKLPLSSSFRVLELLPGIDQDELAYNLHFADWSKPPPYEAISYAWGEASCKVSVSCDGYKMQITENLRSALLYLRLRDRSRLLWADAIWYHLQAMTFM